MCTVCLKMSIKRQSTSRSTRFATSSAPLTHEQALHLRQQALMSSSLLLSAVTSFADRLADVLDAVYLVFERSITSCRFSTPLQSSGLRAHASGTARHCQDDATYHVYSLAASSTKLFANATSCVLAHHRLVKKQAVNLHSPFHFGRYTHHKMSLQHVHRMRDSTA